MTPASIYRADYGTSFRDVAAVLTLAVESGSEVFDREALADRLARPTAQPVDARNDLGAAGHQCADRPPRCRWHHASTACSQMARWCGCWMPKPLSRPWSVKNEVDQEDHADGNNLRRAI